MGLLNWGAGIAAAGAGLSKFAGVAGLELMKSQLEDEKVRLADTLSTQRETNLASVRAGYDRQAKEEDFQRSISPEAQNAKIDVAGGEAAVRGAVENKLLAERPQTEISKLESDYKAGRISTVTYESAKARLTRDPDILSPEAYDQRIRITQAGVDIRTRAAEDAAHYDLNDPEDKAYVEGIANYRVRPPSAGRNPIQRRAAIEAAQKVNPDYNEGLFDQSAKALRDFGTGKQGDIARSLNVSVAHLETLRDLGRALDNGNVNIINAAKQRFAEEFGVPAPTNFDTAKAIVADEVAKGVIGGQTAQSDRQTLADSLKRSRSFDQIDGSITTFQSLLGGQLGGLRSQYERTTRAKDFDETFLSEPTRRALGASEAKSQGGGNPAGTGGPVQIKSDDDYAKLPSGAEFIAPDGSHRRKP